MERKLHGVAAMLTRAPLRLASCLASICACGSDGTPAQDTDATQGEVDGTADDASSSPTTDPDSVSTGVDATTDPDDTTVDEGPSDGSGTDDSTGEPPPGGCAEASAYTLATATYFGGAAGWEHARDVAIDGAGNLVMVGGTTASDFPTTAGAYDETWNTGGDQIGPAGQSDAFVAKFDPQGQLVWSTVLGGPNYDRAYAVEIDEAGDVYVGGRAGPGFPVSEDALQPSFTGGDTGFYGQQNGFAAKLSADGSTLIWASYVGIGALVRDLDVDDAGSLALKLGHNDASPSAPAWLDAALARAYQPATVDARDAGLVVLSTDGAPQWASWIGGAGIDTEEGSIRIDGAGRPVVVFNTQSADLPTTAGVVGPDHHGGEDLWVGMFSADGSDLVFGTYVGGSGLDVLETHALGVATDGVYVMAMTDSDDLPITPGAAQPARAGALDVAVVRLDETGALVAATYFGGTAGEGADGFSVTLDGEVLFVGETDSPDLPVTPDAHQGALATGPDAYLVRLSADLETVRYATYLGGPPHDTGRGAVIGDDCTVVLVGAADGDGFPVHQAWQPNFAGGAADFGNGDNILAKFTAGR